MTPITNPPSFFIRPQKGSREASKAAIEAKNPGDLGSKEGQGDVLSTLKVQQVQE